MSQNYKENSIRQFNLNGKTYHYYSIKTLEEYGYDVTHMPYSIKVLLESVLRQYDGYVITKEHIERLADWKNNSNGAEIPFKPARVILQDFTGVPAVVDLASMRWALADAVKLSKRDAEDLNDMDQLLNQINPEVDVDLVIDHSVQVDYYGNADALLDNMKLEFNRNIERYEFLNWARNSFENFHVVPPATGIVHQVNLEYLAKVVITKEENNKTVVYPDTLVGTDSHTTMINGLGVLGWGVGGIEAEAGMLGQPSYFPVPEVIGVKLTGKLPEGATATDLALRVTNLLRARGVVGKFVEFFGRGVSGLSLADRATVANMAPEYGATCGFFPVDKETIEYLKLSGRKANQIELVQQYLTENSLFNQENGEEPYYTEIIELDLDTVQPALSGPKRPQDLIPLKSMKQSFVDSVTSALGNQGHGLDQETFNKHVEVTLANGKAAVINTGSIVIAAITSCTNTSNPSVMLGAGLLARNAVKKGLNVPAHVKTSLTPGSKVVSGYLERAGLQKYLDELGFHIVGYGCATCIGNSGPLLPEISSAITVNELLVASVLSGNRNFEGRIHPLVKANYLASPPFVVAFALAGTIHIDLTREPLGSDKDGNPVYLKDIWPSPREVNEMIQEYVKPDLFQREYATVYDKNNMWNSIDVKSSSLYKFKDTSTYIQNPPFFTEITNEPTAMVSLNNLRIVAKFGDSITTDHISPAGAIGKHTPAGQYLTAQGVSYEDFNTYGSRRGNHQVMMRGTFANIRIRNQIAPEKEGGYTVYWPTKEVMTIYDACMKYKENNIGLVVLAGKDYGMGSSRDWAAKGPNLLGIKAVIAESFERIHRSNLVMMGILPLQFLEGQSAGNLGLDGEEEITINLSETIKPRDKVKVIAKTPGGMLIEFDAIVRFDSVVDMEYYRHGGILQMVLRNKMK